ncbi:MAG: septum formation initiator family protein [Patescibacteria group bacterium]
MKKLKRILLLLILTFLLFTFTKNLFDYQKNLSFYESFKNDFEKARKNNIALRTQILKNKDPQVVEETIRDNLNLLKPNEVSIIIPTPTPQPKPITPAPGPIYQQWLNLLF